MRRPKRTERGVALLMVTVSIAILTAVAAEFAFQTRVDLELATHQRDALRAEYLAKSSIGLARMLLLFQKQLDRTTGQLPGPAQGINLQLWRMAKLDCHLMQSVVPQSGKGRRGKFAITGAGGVDEEGRIQYGGFAGCFDARIEDEQEKLNVNALAGLQTGTAQGAVQRLYNLVSDKRFDFVFDREDANRIRATPNDVLLGLKDWVDDDDTQSALQVTALGQVTLQPGFSDEAALYSRYTPRYRPKNAWFDSLGELYLVNGVTDWFMAAFGDRLTVYPDPNAPLNVNSDDPLLIALAIRSIADPSRPDPRLNDPVFLDGIVQKIRAAKAMMPMGFSVQDFTTVVQAAGIAINPQVVQRQGTGGTTANTFLGDKSDTYRIVATGNAGNVERRVTAVIRLSDPTRDGLGRVLYWEGGLMPRVLGLDLGSHSLKGVLLEATGRGTAVLRFAETRRADEAPLDEALAVFLAENPWAPDQVVVALPGPSLATHVFTLPFTDTKRIAATLPFEVEAELPFELSQVVFDHQVTRRRANATDLVVGLVRREELAELLRTLSARGLDPRVVTHPAIAYQNLLLAAPERFEVAPDAAIAVLDIGHRRTSVAVGRPAEGLVFARTFAGGGRDLSRALATEFQVPLPEAEAWKEREGSLAAGGGPEHERARAALLRALGPVVREARATLKAASGREHLPVARLLLSGGTARLPGLAEHLGAELGQPTDLLFLPAVAAAVVPPEVQPRAAAAYTLALRGTMSSGRAPRFNLRQGEFAFRGHVDYLRERLIRVAAFAGVLALLLCVFNVTRGILLGRREAAVDARICALTQRVLGTCEKNYDRALNLLRGQQSPAAAVPSVSTTRLLAEVAQRVPPDVTVTFGQMVFDLDRIQLRGETDSTRSIDKLAAALKSYRCFREVKEGKVERARDSSRVQFTLDVQVDCGDQVASAGSGS